jgi:uncharacterized membrane protein
MEAAMASSRNTLIMVGAVLALLGTAGLAIPEFNTQQQKNVATVGDLKIQTEEKTPHTIPPLLAGGVLLVGVVLLGSGMLRQT